MKTKFLFFAALLHGALIIGINVKGYGQSGVPAQVGKVYFYFDDTIKLGQFQVLNTMHDTVLQWKIVHDTTVKIVYDTVLKVFNDTVTITQSFPVYLHDTIYLTQTIHDSLYITQIVHDTVCPAAPAHVLTTIFTTQALPIAPAGNDNAVSGKTGIEVGLKFSSSQTGYIQGIRFYKVSGNSGTHTGELYSSTGTRLAQAVFTNETATGWQTVTFSSPVAVTAGTIYMAACFSASGYYSSTLNSFITAIVNSPLTGLADGTSGINGVYSYGNAPLFPVSGYKSSNYWVEPIYSATK